MLTKERIQTLLTEIESGAYCSLPMNDPEEEKDAVGMHYVRTLFNKLLSDTQPAPPEAKKMEWRYEVSRYALYVNDKQVASVGALRNDVPDLLIEATNVHAASLSTSSPLVERLGEMMKQGKVQIDFIDSESEDLQKFGLHFNQPEQSFEVFDDNDSTVILTKSFTAALTTLLGEGKQ